MNAINHSHLKSGRNARDAEAYGSAQSHFSSRLAFGKVLFEMARFAFRSFNESAKPCSAKRINRTEIAVENGTLKLGEDQFPLNTVPYVTVNSDPNPTNGLAGAIEVIAKEFSGPDGFRILPHRYVVVGEGGEGLGKLAAALKKASVQVDALSVDHKLFSETFLGAPQIK